MRLLFEQNLDWNLTSALERVSTLAVYLSVRLHRVLILRTCNFFTGKRGGCMAVKGGCWDSEFIFRVSVCVSVCVQAGFGGCVFVRVWMCALPLWPLSCFRVRSLRHLIMERVVAGNHNRNKPLRGGIFIGAKKKKSCFQENKRSGRGLVLIGSGVWGKWGEKRIISSWEMVKFY